MRQCRTDILMYHSISRDVGPTSISPDVFARQMQAIADANVPVISMDEVAARFQAKNDAPYAIAITFDDAFEDFETAAWPILQSHGFMPTVFVPSNLMGGHENWTDCNVPARKIMGWASIERLSAEGVQFGSHSRTHADLTNLDAAGLEDELSMSKKNLESRLGCPVRHFAPPYGYSNLTVRNQIAHLYVTSVGTVFGTACVGSDIYDLPRIEMYYYRQSKHWNRHLSGGGNAYMARRKFLRKIGEIVRRSRKGLSKSSSA